MKKNRLEIHKRHAHTEIQKEYWRQLIFHNHALKISTWVDILISEILYMITISYCEFGSLSRCKIFYFPTLLQLGACMISYAMNMPLFKDIFIHMLTVLWPNVYVVISKMFPCHHYDINSESNRCTSPTSTFSLQLWGYKKKDKQIKELTKCRTRIIWSLDWILSSCP